MPYKNPWLQVEIELCAYKDLVANFERIWRYKFALFGKLGSYERKELAMLEALREEARRIGLNG